MKSTDDYERGFSEGVATVMRSMELDLLPAAKSAMRELQGHNWSNRGRNTYTILRDAIAKAEGKTPEALVEELAR